MNTNAALKSTALFYRDERSDKEYHVSIDPAPGGFMVNIAYGKRGSSLRTLPKTKAPVDLEKAEKIYAKIVAEQMADGYTPAGGAVAFAGTEKEGQVSGLAPQLLNEITEAEAERYINDPGWVGQPKYDGERRLMRGREGINRKGLFRPVVIEIANAVERATSETCDLDGEEVGNVLHVFDILGCAADDYRGKPYRERLELLEAIVSPNEHVRLVETAFTTEAKREMLARLKAGNAEGMVFKRLNATHTAGRPNSGGDQLKLKFWATASVRVAAQNDKRSVAMEVLKDGVWIGVGNVTIAPDKAVPAVGAVIEVRYLYAYRGGSLYQTTFLRTRDDIDESDCVESQLKYTDKGSAAAA